MNKDTLIGNWKQFTGEAKRRWGKLTDDEFTEIEGNRTKLAGKIQEAYGVAKEEAEEQVAAWEKECRKQFDRLNS